MEKSLTTHYGVVGMALGRVFSCTNHAKVETGVWCSLLAHQFMVNQPTHASMGKWTLSHDNDNDNKDNDDDNKDDDGE